MKKILIVLVCLFLSGCWTTPEPPEPNEVAYRAFFVGVGRYENGWTLPSPAENTEKLENLFNLCRFGEDETEFSIIKPLVDLEATKENILNGIISTFAEADENDVSYFYYMGHGGLNCGIPIITPTDYNKTLISGITVHELEEHLNMIAGTKVIFLETCHAGNFIDKDKDVELEAFTEFSLDLLNKEGYQVLASSAGNEYTWDGGNGLYFCKHLIEGCENLTADTNEDGIVDISELYQYIKLNVAQQTVQIYPEGSTFPIYEFN